MGKKATPRRLKDNEAMAIGRMLRGSPQKLNLVAQTIRGQKVGKALTALTWKAGLSMRTAIQVQLRVARVPPTEVLNAKDGTDYPLSDDELQWHADMFTG